MALPAEVASAHIAKLPSKPAPIPPANTDNMSSNDVDDDATYKFIPPCSELLKYVELPPEKKALPAPPQRAGLPNMTATNHTVVNGASNPASPSHTPRKPQRSVKQFVAMSASSTTSTSTNSTNIGTLPLNNMNANDQSPISKKPLSPKVFSKKKKKKNTFFLCQLNHILFYTY